MSWKLNDTKNFHKNFHDVLETGIRVEIKRLIFFHEQIKFEVAPKKEVVCDLGISTNQQGPGLHLVREVRIREKSVEKIFIRVNFKLQ